MASTYKALVAAGIALSLVLVLGGQAAARAAAPEASGAATGQAVGKAASSYLTGLRTYAAAVLWNRLDPVTHRYYEDVALDDQVFTLTTIAAVQALDPHAIQSYFVGSWILVRNDRKVDGMAMAKNGVENNPTAGLVFINYAQLLWLEEQDIVRAAGYAERSISPEMTWVDIETQQNQYLMAAAIFRQAAEDATSRGDAAAAAKWAGLDAYAKQRVEELDLELASEEPHVDHDHNGDGVADH